LPREVTFAWYAAASTTLVAASRSTTLERAPTTSTTREWVCSAPGAAAKPNVATRSNGTGSDTDTKKRPASIALM
jgi:hypothetical protein